jgi:hypothetical protein
VDLLLFRRINARRPWRIERVHGPFAGIYRTRAACAKDVARFAILPYPRDAE